MRPRPQNTAPARKLHEPNNLGTRDVARILGASADTVRRHVRAGLCKPTRRGRAFRFTFQDVVLLRSAHGLIRAGIAVRRIRRILPEVARRIGERPLASLRFRAEGKRIIVHDGTNPWNAESGQFLFGFKPGSLRRPATVLVAGQRAAQNRAGRGVLVPTVDWFDRAVALETAGDLEAARDAYRRALGDDPGHADACINLGRLLHYAGQLAEAGRLYQRALKIDPRDAVAHYNLALILEDQARPVQAIRHYQMALGIAPDFADAHFNLARLFEERGAHADAARHLVQYEQLTGG